jgi:dTDP-4-amino-4,6-dideoxygalactose transaminase
MIPVTKTFLPPIEAYTLHLKQAFANGWLTNRGELVLELESILADYLDLKDTNVLCLNNGTIPLQIALKLLGKSGEIITTPFSYIATTAAIVWEDCTPVFVDIHPEYLTIDETKIEASITEKTTCILATHVFGNPCNVEEIDRIAKKHNLKVIYDSAHCFGVKYKGVSVFEYGDISTCSFHATKVFHTGEGGAIFCKDRELYHKIFYSHNFGHDGPYNFQGLGINGKMSELHAAMGLTVINYINEILDERKRIVDYFRTYLTCVDFEVLLLRDSVLWNYSYYPIIFHSEKTLLKVLNDLNNFEIYPRRYFYPSLNTIEYLNNLTMPISESISSRILCLPLYVGLNDEELRLIVSIINNN